MSKNPESQKPNRTLLYVGGGCAVLLFCVICLVGVYAIAGSAIQQTFDQLQSGSGSPPPVAPPVASSNTRPAPSPTSAGALSATSAAQPTTAAGGNPLDALTKSFRGWGGVKSFRAKMNVTGAPGAAQSMTLEMVMPDRFHMTNAQFEMILIANTTYVKIGGTWQKMTMPQSVDLNLFNPKSYETQFSTPGAPPDIKILGPEVIDGTPTIGYQITPAPKPGTPPTSTKIWIGVADGLPRKVEAGNAVITFYDFNANIVINAPIP